jgi:hypothetical protein
MQVNLTRQEKEQEGMPSLGFFRVFLALVHSFVAHANYLAAEANSIVAPFRIVAQAVWKIDLLGVQVVGDDSGYVIINKQENDQATN